MANVTENTIRELTLDALFELIRIKIDKVKLLRDIADHKELLDVVDDIKVIQEVIDQ